MLINLPARACTLCGRTDQLVRDGSRTMGPHAKWNTRLNLGAGARLNGGDVVPEPFSTASCMEVDKAALKCDRLPVQLHALP